MNYGMIRYTLGWILLFESAFLTIPLITAMAYGEWWPLASIAITMAICMGLGWLMSFKKPENMKKSMNWSWSCSNACMIFLEMKWFPKRNIWKF